MAERSSEARARERQKALVCHQLFGEESALLRLGRYQLLRTLGRGGMGTVYEACDPNHAQRIALKMLHRRGPVALYRLKREFRSLAELDHENLARLYELAIDGDDAYFTMELVEGSDFVSYVRGEHAPGQPVRDEQKLLAALQQLAQGIQALHAAGKLHCDLKPSNVLVSSAGRVVLLDFGLVHDADDPTDEIAGTPAYMAPEQALGDASVASDWYSFGRILEQALYGRVADRADHRTVAAALLSPTYGRLQRLLEGLLHPVAARRPTVYEVQHQLGGSVAMAALVARSGVDRNEPFVGRERELTALSSALEEASERAVLVLVRGEAGIGKSALVRRFVQLAPRARPLIVLHGRCYEREFVPFKALDGAIDELSRFLLTCSEVPELTDEQCAALLQIFPVLGRVPGLAASSAAGPCHPAVLRERGFAALNALLAGLARRHTLVVCIEDLQWSDADSGRLLAAMLGGRTSAPLLVIGCERGDPSLCSPALEELRGQSPEQLPRLELALGPLESSEALTLCASVTRDIAPRLGPEKRAELHASIAREARGNPRFLLELARFARSAPAAFTRGEGGISLDSLVFERVQRLAPTTRACLELIAIAGRPISLALIAQALDLERDPRARIDELRRARLVRTVVVSGEELLDVEHDQVGEAVLKRLDTAKRRAVHAQFARAVERSNGANVEGLVEQYIAAGMAGAAAHHARRAGDLALATLAFARAAWCYRQALAHGAWSASERANLSSDLARALEHSGRGLEAAQAYRLAATGAATLAESARLLQRAAELLMNNGRHREGELLLARCYELHGFFWPRTRARLWIEIVRLLVLANCREQKPQGDEDAARRVRAEFLDANGPIFEGWDLARALYNALLALHEAERMHDPVWRARARALRGLMRCVGLHRGGLAHGLAEFEAAHQTVVRLGDANAEAKLDGALSFAYLLAGDSRRALVHAEACEARIRLMQPTPTVLCVAMGLIGLALFELGQLRECARRFRALERETRECRDVVAGFWVHVHPVQMALLFAAVDREGARATLARQQALIREHPHFTFLQWTHALCLVETELYWGSAESAVALLLRSWRLLSKADLGLVCFSELAAMVRARVCLAAAQEALGAERRALLRRARKDALALTRAGRASARGAAWLMLAGVHLLEGHRAAARRDIGSALDILEGLENKLVLACARYGLGRIVGGRSGEELERRAVETLREEGVEQPERWIGWCTPAVRSLLPASAPHSVRGQPSRLARSGVDSLPSNASSNGATEAPSVRKDWSARRRCSFARRSRLATVLTGMPSTAATSDAANPSQ